MNDDGFFDLIAIFLTALIAFMAGSLIGEKATENKCLKAGALIIDNKVYECRVADVVSKQQNQERQEEQ